MYPKLKYHKEHGMVCCKSESEEERLGNEWFDSVADVGVKNPSADDEKFMRAKPIFAYLKPEKKRKLKKKEEPKLLDEKDDFLKDL